MQKLVGFGDCRTSSIVERIADEEVAHVAVGVYWFVDACRKMGRVPCSTFKGFYLSFQLGSVSILIKAHSINHIIYRKYLEVLQIY